MQIAFFVFVLKHQSQPEIGGASHFQILLHIMHTHTHQQMTIRVYIRDKACVHLLVSRTYLHIHSNMCVYTCALVCPLTGKEDVCAHIRNRCERPCRGLRVYISPTCLHIHVHVHVHITLEVEVTPTVLHLSVFWIKSIKLIAHIIYFWPRNMSN